jgi:FkbM family methyltransferase
VIKSDFLTFIFQKYLNKGDIRDFKHNFIYYLIFRFVRNFLSRDLILQIYNFKVYGSVNKNKTSYFLLKKCEFGDYHELYIIKKYSDLNKLLFIDCGCNYGFYSFYTASLSEKNKIISIEASKDTSKEFNKNLNLNNFKNINFFNNAVSDISKKNISFYESVNDWESSQAHYNFAINSELKVETIKIDNILVNYLLNDYVVVIKLDIEGNEINAIKGALEVIKKSDPLIIMEFSKYIFKNRDNINYLKNFLVKYDYSIYDTNYNKKNLDDILNMLKNLKKRYKTIGNFYLIKNFSKNLKIFLSNE